VKLPSRRGRSEVIARKKTEVVRRSMPILVESAVSSASELAAKL